MASSLPPSPSLVVRGSGGTKATAMHWRVQDGTECPRHAIREHRWNDLEPGCIRRVIPAIESKVGLNDERRQRGEAIQGAEGGVCCLGTNSSRLVIRSSPGLQ